MSSSAGHQRGVFSGGILLWLLVQLAIGGYFFSLLREFPLIRNGLYYGNIALQMIASHGQVAQMFFFEKLYKGIGISLLAWPLVKTLGIDLAVKGASFGLTAAFILSSVVFFHHFNKRFRIASKYLYLETLLIFFNPLLIHQFASGFPDTGLSACVTLLMVVMDKLLWGERVYRMALLAAMLFIGTLLMKAAGLIYFPILLSVFGFGFLRAKGPDRWSFLGAMSVFLILIIIIVGLMQARLLGPFYIGFSNFKYFSETMDGGSAFSLLKKMVVFGETLLLSFSSMMAYAIWLLPVMARKWHLSAMWLFFASGLFFLGLLAEFGTASNLRYFLPLFPSVSLALSFGFMRCSERLLKWASVACFLTINAITIFAYNHPTAHAMIPKSWPIIFRAHDNFRLPLLLKTKHTMDLINANVPQDGVLYILDAYYSVGEQSAGHLVYQHSRLLREDIRVQSFSKVKQMDGLPEEPVLLWNKYGLDPENETDLTPWLEQHQVTIIDEDLYWVKKRDI